MVTGMVMVTIMVTTMVMVMATTGIITVAITMEHKGKGKMMGCLKGNNRQI